MRRSCVGIITVVLVLLMAGQALANHVVQPGETLWKISQQYNTTVAQLAGANNLNNVNYIIVGQRLALPGQAKAQTVVHTVKPGETLWMISRAYSTTVASIAQENGITNVNIVNAGAKLTIPGAKQVLSQALSRGGRVLSAGEFDLFARLVQSEAGGESYQGQVAVAAAVLNRVDSSRFPNTVTGVINQVVDGYYQYSPVLDGRIKQPASDSARRAVVEAVGGADPTNGATGFYNP
ncbi:MAG: LysM peptidoglycan-binding domain-containing protein, partial [Firmicutes bacterium]|nr:LysM peptidoglycan-binding domain-containing protein [Bacillota bacterium]